MKDKQEWREQGDCVVRAVESLYQQEARRESGPSLKVEGGAGEREIGSMDLGVCVRWVLSLLLLPCQQSLEGVE